MRASDSARCVFCDIVAGIEISSRVYEDEHVLAFMDLAPVNPGHALIVPKVHAAGLMELEAESGVRLWRVAHVLARALRGTDLRCDGVNIFMADGEAAFSRGLPRAPACLPSLLRGQLSDRCGLAGA